MSCTNIPVLVRLNGAVAFFADIAETNSLEMVLALLRFEWKKEIWSRSLRSTGDMVDRSLGRGSAWYSIGVPVMAEDPQAALSSALWWMCVRTATGAAHKATVYRFDSLDAFSLVICFVVSCSNV